jgi:hypothetical protein
LRTFLDRFGDGIQGRRKLVFRVCQMIMDGGNRLV